MNYSKYLRTKRQQSIYDGLSTIGPEISGFYLTGLMLFETEMPNKVNCIIHCLREIDGGLRDFLGIDYIEENRKEKTNKLESVCNSLNIADPKHVLVRKWKKTTDKFHAYAHRHGAWKQPRDPDEKILKIWADFEEVLYILVGSFYSLINRIERIKLIENHDKDSVKGVISNLLRDEALYREFFRNFDKLDWFHSLKSFYNPNSIKCDSEGRSQFWVVLVYLEKVSIQNEDDTVFIELLEIIKNVIDFSRSSKENEIKDYYNWWHIAKILVNVPVRIITEYFKDSKYNFHDTIFEITDHEFNVSLAITEFGEKLLPKLFKAKEIDFALDIIDLITTIEKHDSTDSLGSCKSKFETYNIDKIFKNNYPNIIALDNKRIIELLLKRFNDSLMFNRFESKEHFEFKENFFNIKISRVREEDNSIKENLYLFSFSEYDKREINNSFKVSEKNMSDVNFLMYLNHNKPEKEIFNLKFKGSFDELKSMVSEHLKANNFTDIDIDLPLGRVYRNLFHDFFNIKISDLDSENDIMGSRDDAAITLLKIIKEIFLQYIEKNNNIVEKYIQEFLSDKYQFPIFKRLAYYFIYKSEAAYLDIFYNKVEKVDDVLVDVYYELEIYRILQKLNSKFTADFIKVLDNRINEVAKKVEKEKGEWFVFKWCSALKDNPNFKEKYEELAKKFERKEPYYPFISRVESRWASDVLVPPISDNKIKEMIDVDFMSLIQFLKEYKSEYSEFDQEFYGKPGKIGLANTLSFVVKDNPGIFIDNLSEFQAVDILYLKNILNGIELAIHDEKEIDYVKIIDFFRDYLENIEWNEKEDENYNYKDTTQRDIVSRVIDILERGIELKNFEVSKDNQERIESIIEKVLVYPYEERDYEIKDFITYTLNTILGKLIMLYVDFSLKYANAHGKEEDWGKNKYEKLYNKGVDGKILLGYYLPQINYLDKDYVNAKIEEIQTSDPEWKPFVSGYISSSRLYSDIVNKMRQHYIHAIEFMHFSSIVERKLIEHIALAYLYYNDSLEKENNDDGSQSLIYKLFNTLNEKFTERMLSLSEYIGMSHDVGKKNELIELWKYIFKNQDKFENNMGDKYKEFPGHLIEISKLIDNIDDEFAEIMKWNIKFVESYHIQYFFKTLTKFESADQILYISDILTDMLDMPVPSYDKGYITILVKRIYAVPELKPKADVICNAYGRQGVHFLRELYEENNKG